LSYIERATYDYIIKILSEGTRVLFSRRFILFTFLLISSGILSVFALNYSNINRNTAELVLIIQATISISFIIAGLFAKRLLSTIKRFFLLISMIIVIGLIGVLSSTEYSSQYGTEVLIPIRNLLLEYYPILSFLAWTIIMPIAAFAFARGMFYNKITGSILFLGKPEEDHNAVFAFFLALIALVGILASVAIIFTNLEEVFFQIYGLTALILSILMLLVIFGKIFRNDALNSAIGVFFVVTTIPSMILILISSTGDPGVGLFNYILLILSLIYTAQGQAKRASRHADMTDEEIRITLAKEKLDDSENDPYGISRIVRFIGAEGLVLIFLGIFLGYILLQLEFFHDSDPDKASELAFNPLLSNLSTQLTVGQLYQIFSIFVVFFIFIVILISYYFYPPAKKYYRANLIRLNFLPNYDEVKAYVTAVQKGDITKKDMTADAVKLVGGQLAKLTISKGRGIIRRLTGRD